ncbi:Peptidase_C39 like family protein [Hathewaya proteolytica DSM 3090]|uniref:Peptidase_C39 like family protein n=1 Tax=Hathewaya proteolytica DSM 3090 TaxID=1121331 RepID=A0A1M6QXP1_9CLOT|nr:C39 family peptidase [Hathewaya proteolytica]SHK24837.1 Peptidase_C39 like family protein [Hathewaya proteolytica DSM 3090]
MKRDKKIRNVSTKNNNNNSKNKSNKDNKNNKNNKDNKENNKKNNNNKNELIKESNYKIKKIDYKKSSDIYLIKQSGEKKKSKLKKWIKAMVAVVGATGSLMFCTYFYKGHFAGNNEQVQIKEDHTQSGDKRDEIQNNISGNGIKENSDSLQSNASNYVKCEVGEPKKRTDEEVYSELKKMSNNDEKVKKIYDEKEKYPVALLSSLVNNPEMINFVSGYLSRGAVEASSYETHDIEKKNSLILQWDKRWGYKPYGNSIIAVSGCAPTCLSMVINSMSDYVVTPDEMAKFSENNGFYIKGVGTDWKLMTKAVIGYGIKGKEMSFSEQNMKVELDSGNVLIATMSPGDFTAEGHFVVIHGYGKDGFYINDPNCVYRSKKPWSYEKLSTQINNMWSYSKMKW